MSDHPQKIGRYRILRLLGSGAMGDVYLAEDPNIGRELAIKTVRVLGGSPEDVEDRKQRLLREARAAGKFVHPNVVTLFDADEADGTLYLAFEYVPPGIDLAKRMVSQPQVTLRQALRWVREIAQALHYAHRQGIVHRDIKPSNVLIAADGTAKVADFGIAKLLGPGTELTRTGSVVGSPQYMSPEQVRGETLDGRSDVFSLGVVFYELLCGIRPFGGETLSTLVFEILSKEPPPVGSLRPSLPGELVALAHRMLAKDRNHRSATAEAVVDDIRKLEASIPAHQLDDTAAPSDVEETRRIATAISQQIDQAAQNQEAGAEAPTVASDAISTPGFVPPPPPAGTGAPSDPTLAASQHPPPAPTATPTPMSTQQPARGAAAAASSGSKTARNVVLGLGVLGFVAIVGLVGLWFLLHSFAPQFLPAVLGGSQPADFMEMETAEATSPDDAPDDAVAEPAAETSVPDGPPASTSATPVAEPAATDRESPDEPESQAAVEAIRDEVARARTEPEPAPPPSAREPEPAREQTSPPPPPPPVRRVEPEPEPEPVRSAAPPPSVTRPPPEPEREAERPSEPPPDPEPRVDRDLQRWRAAASRANREMSTGLRFRFDIKPKDLLAIVRVWPEGGDIIVKGQAEDFKDGRRGEDMTLPGDGDHLVQLIVGGEVQHSILVHASAGNPQTTTVSLDLR